MLGYIDPVLGLPTAAFAGYRGFEVHAVRLGNLRRHAPGLRRLSTSISWIGARRELVGLRICRQWVPDKQHA
jgi:hypothetical protein